MSKLKLKEIKWLFIKGIIEYLKFSYYTNLHKFTEESGEMS